MSEAEPTLRADSSYFLKNDKYLYEDMQDALPEWYGSFLNGMQLALQGWFVDRHGGGPLFLRQMLFSYWTCHDFIENLLPYVDDNYSESFFPQWLGVLILEGYLFTLIERLIFIKTNYWISWLICRLDRTPTLKQIREEHPGGLADWLSMFAQDGELFNPEGLDSIYDLMILILDTLILLPIVTVIDLLANACLILPKSILALSAPFLEDSAHNKGRIMVTAWLDVNATILSLIALPLSMIAQICHATLVETPRTLYEQATQTGEDEHSEDMSTDGRGGRGQHVTTDWEYGIMPPQPAGKRYQPAPLREDWFEDDSADGAGCSTQPHSDDGSNPGEEGEFVGGVYTANAARFTSFPPPRDDGDDDDKCSRTSSISDTQPL